ncbi:tetraspanin-7-like [Pelobates cultripes]|nr:tetraspanin-7-like [Pelobates cultripes]
MTDEIADQVLLKRYAAVKDHVFEQQSSTRKPNVPGFPMTYNPSNAWVLPAYSQEDSEGHPSVPGGRIRQHDDILDGSLVISKSHRRHNKKWRGSGMALLKASLMAFSFVFWVAGLVMLTVGIWAKLSLEEYLVLSTNDYPNTPLILLVSGAAVLLWGFLGCLSAAAEKRFLLRIYGLFQMAVLVAGLAAGLSGLFYRRDIADGFESGLQDAVISYSEDEEKADALDVIQRALHCCGVHSYLDWLDSPWSIEQREQHSYYEYSNGSVPSSCCQARRGCHNSPVLAGAPGIHREGCFKKVCDFVSDNMFYIATAALGLAIMQVVGIILTCVLATKITQRMSDMVPT